MTAERAAPTISRRAYLEGPRASCSTLPHAVVRAILLFVKQHDRHQSTIVATRLVCKQWSRVAFDFLYDEITVSPTVTIDKPVPHREPASFASRYVDLVDCPAIHSKVKRLCIKGCANVDSAVCTQERSTPDVPRARGCVIRAFLDLLKNVTTLALFDLNFEDCNCNGGHGSLICWTYMQKRHFEHISFRNVRHGPHSMTSNVFMTLNACFSLSHLTYDASTALSAQHYTQNRGWSVVPRICTPHITVEFDNQHGTATSPAPSLPVVPAVVRDSVTVLDVSRAGCPGTSWIKDLLESQTHSLQELKLTGIWETAVLALLPRMQCLHKLVFSLYVSLRSGRSLRDQGGRTLVSAVGKLPSSVRQLHIIFRVFDHTTARADCVLDTASWAALRNVLAQKNVSTLRLTMLCPPRVSTTATTPPQPWPWARTCSATIKELFQRNIHAGLNVRLDTR